MSASLSVAPERGRADRRAFLALPYRLYRGHPVWVPPLRMAERDTQDRRHPFFRHAEVRHFLARRGRRVVGRIAAIHNRLHNEFHGDRLGFFGLFDVAPDPEAAAALLEAAVAWNRERGLDPVRGPVNYSTNATCGVLVEGFDLPPVILMPYNRPDYDALIRQAGFVGAQDLLALRLVHDLEVPERARRVVERRMERGGIRLRSFDLRDLPGEVARLTEVYNRTWEGNWGYSPMTPEEFAHAGRQMRPLVEPHMSCVAEVRGRPVGFSLVLRDLNRLLRGTRGYLALALPRLPRLRRLSSVRVVALGLMPEFRRRGINEALLLRAVDEGRAHGVLEAEASWILEDNELMLTPLRAFGATPTKRYRMYETRSADGGSAG